jgi:hypothetical protein
MTSSISNWYDHDLIKSWNMFWKKSEIEIVSLETENINKNQKRDRILK